MQLRVRSSWPVGSVFDYCPWTLFHCSLCLSSMCLLPSYLSVYLSFHLPVYYLLYFYLYAQNPLRPFPASCVFNSHSLASTPNSGDYSVSCTHVITVRRISRNWNVPPIVFKIIYRHVPRRKHSPFIVIEVCLPLHCLAMVAARTTYKTSFFYYYMLVCCGRHLAMAAVYRVTG
jgi:hypothetical protein